MTVRYDSEAATGLRTAGHDGVLVATLDRPPANALNRPLLLAMIALFRDRGEGDPPPVVITGAGDRFFCAGGDIKEVDGAAAGPIQQRMRGFHNLLVAMERYRAPVIAAVNGDCVGGGVEYALFADAVLAAPHARFGFPEIRHGLLPADKGIQRLIRLIGMRRARDLLLSGELIGAEEAARWGLVDAIIEPGRLMIEALDRAREAGRRAPVLYAALKHAVNDYDDIEDQQRADVTLAKAASWIDDPVARSLREGWRKQRAPSRSSGGTPPALNTTPDHT
ncbi:enoyl-CoA hydratase/isomerase family protein [Bradyrhizobium sp. SK17]|jgi:enoyl-CoA hydratase|uniref:enoyl-CoA hydratase/isomerase family protein n=1 Tax=Bradyrhizobium sp. SK17 TaxID=2057741 RepID=UPI000C30C271|nr:enoyl-CoA hydratase/isomerase family protein [Bradyrhizobium sp. SK17]AUC94719.1 enoyl-CoA hydratase/isomerase family protein [Bradyrhizobium sp. SK17]